MNNIQPPDVIKTIEDDLPRGLANAVALTDADHDIHMMQLSGAGKAFCSSDDLTHYATGNGPNQAG